MKDTNNKINPVSSEFDYWEDKLDKKEFFDDSLELNNIIKYTKSIIDSFDNQWVVIYSKDFRIKMINNLVSEMYWLKEEEVVWKLTSEIMSNTENLAIKNQLEDILNWKAPYSIDFELKLNHSWKNFYVRKVAKVIRDSQEKIIWILWLYTDITNTKEKNKENLENTFFLNESQEKASIWSFKADLKSWKWLSSVTLNKIFGIESSGEKDIDLWLNLIHPDDIEMMKDYFNNNILLKWENFDKEYRIIRRNEDRDIWVHWVWELSFDDQLKPKELLWTIKEITEQKKINQELDNTNEILSLLFRHSPIYSFIKEVSETECRVLLLSDNYKKMLGKESKSLIGKPMEEIFPPELAKKMTDDDISVVLWWEVTTIEEEFNDRKYMTIKFPITQSGRVLLAWYTIDITKLKQTEENLRSLKDLLLSITNGTTDLVYTKDLKWRYTLVNKSFQRFLGLEETDIIWKNAEEVFSLDNTYILEQDKKVISNQEHISGEDILHNGLGEKRNLSMNKWPIYDSKWNLNWLFGISRDITEEKENLELLKIVKEQLEIRQRMDSLWTLAWWIWHDFNNLLTWIIWNLSLALMDNTLSVKTINFINNAMWSCYRSADLVRQLQTLSKNSVSEKVSLDIYGVASEVFDLLSKTIDKIINLEIDFKKWDFYVNWSDSEIHQVLLNLWTNSALSIKERGFRKGDFIRISAQDYRAWVVDRTNLPEWDYIHIFFSDNWRWMSEEIIRRAFDPLFSTREKTWTKWQWLWLAMVYNIIANKHNGHISIESKEWLWTTMHIYLPKAKEKELAIKDKVINLDGGSETILVVEDEETIRDLVKRLLESFGYKVILAVDGQDGLDKFIENKELIDLVLLDLSMPRKSGQELLSEISKIKEGINVIISSWQSDDEIKNLPGIKGFVNKPYVVKKFIWVIRKILDEK